MKQEEIDRRVAEGRAFTKACYYDEYQTDQQLRRPQPPLAKAPMGGERVVLPRDFESLPLRNDVMALINGRVSRRIYTDSPLSLLQLSFLLWACQGVKDVRGKNYATLRTVPCGGARHEFELYFVARNVEGLTAGAYHYLPMRHEIERVGETAPSDDTVAASLQWQSWGAKAAVVFYLSMVPSRAEWRYGIYAHRVALMDIGYIGQNLYIAAEALGLGTCAIAAFDQQTCDGMFTLDGQEEYTVYAQPVGAVKAEDKPAERALYAFVHEEPGAQEP